MKILFLKTRNPPEYAFTKLIQKIFKTEAYADITKSILKRYRAAFSDYRYNFRKTLKTLVQEFIDKSERLVCHNIFLYIFSLLYIMLYK